jgi:excinuclease ABC subunit B
MYADTMTKSMRQAVEETDRRRERQIEYNRTHGITPHTVSKPIPEAEGEVDTTKHKTAGDIRMEIIELEAQMRTYADQMEFEKAIECRDRINGMERELKRRRV